METFSFFGTVRYFFIFSRQLPPRGQFPGRQVRRRLPPPGRLLPGDPELPGRRQPEQLPRLRPHAREGVPAQRQVEISNNSSFRSSFKTFFL